MQESITEGTELQEEDQETRDEHEDASVKVGGREIHSLMFADNIALLAGAHNELQEKSESLNQNSKRFGMEICAE